MAAAAPIPIRVAITADEWIAVRQLALARKTRAADLIADAIRKHLLPEEKP